MGPARADTLSYEELQTHFNVPMTQAAKHFGISLTFFKKICRTAGIQRWPFRKLKSLQNKIADLQIHLQDSPDNVTSSTPPPSEPSPSIDEGHDSAVDSSQCLLMLSRSPSRDHLDEADMPSSSEVNTAPEYASCRRPAVTLEALRQHFHLPMTEAAKNFRVSLTLFKKLCRQHGIRRWPHRKLKSLKSKIVDLQTRLESNHGAQESELKRQLEAQLKQGETEAALSDSSAHLVQSRTDEQGSDYCSMEEDDEEVGAIGLAMLCSVVSDTEYEGSSDAASEQSL